MNIENSIENRYREMAEVGFNNEYEELYSDISHPKIKTILFSLHYHYISLFRTMNERLPSGEIGSHFWAEPSRELIKIIEITIGLWSAVKGTEFAFDIDPYYFTIIKKCREFLSKSGGSTIPPGMETIELYFIQPIFFPQNAVTIPTVPDNPTYALKPIDGGSYANVFKYKDLFYDKFFAVKRAKKDLDEKELQRFRREYDEMKGLSSPYILEVYHYNEQKNEYYMEFMDYTLADYIKKKNTTLTETQRKSIVRQILRAFQYIHSKGRLHRDISPKNILIKEYEDSLIVKIADFGLVKIPESELTTAGTEFKGFFNDPSLQIEGFSNYNMLHETYALTRIVAFVLTGKTNTDNIKDDKLRCFIEKGLNSDKKMRYKNVSEIIAAVREL